MNPDLRFAHELADLADVISMSRWRSLDLKVERKLDLTEVTEADRQIEERIRDRLSRRPPRGAGGRRGVRRRPRRHLGGPLGDRPIDGTRSFIRGYETWSCLIALQHDGITVCAIAWCPRSASATPPPAVRGPPPTASRFGVSDIDRVEAAMLAHTSISGFVRVGMDARLRALAGRCWDSRGMGNSLSHLSVARGTADIGWSARANLWDFAALAIIVEEAGGRFTDRSADSPVGGAGVSSNGRLHEVALEAAGLQ